MDLRNGIKRRPGGESESSCMTTRYSSLGIPRHLKEREFRTWKFLACTGLCLKVFGFWVWCRSIFRGIWVSFCAFKHNSWGFMTGFLILMSLSSGGSLEECSDLLIWWCHGKALHDEPSLSLSNSHFSEAFLVVNY